MRCHELEPIPLPRKPNSLSSPSAYFSTTPQAMRSPEFPAGSVL